MKKIIIHTTINIGGGTGSVIENLTEIQKHSYDKVYVSVPKKYRNIAENLLDGVEIVDSYENLQFLRFMIRGTNIKKLYRKISLENPDSDIKIVCHGVAVAGLFGSVPKNMFVVLHGHVLQDNRFLKCLLFRMCFAKLKHKKVKFVSVSKETQTYYKDKFGIDSTQISNGVIIHNDKKQNQLFTIGFAGYLCFDKGYEFLIKAAKILKENGFNNFKVVLAGEEFENGAAQNLIECEGVSDVVEYVGFIKDFANALLPSYDLLVLPSLMEGLPMSLIEAQGYGIPILATNVGGIPELLDDGINGYFIERNADNIAECIEKCLNKANYLRLSNNSKQKYQEGFTAEVMTYKYDKLLSNSK